jgi:hypothetical protein
MAFLGFIEQTAVVKFVFIAAVCSFSLLSFCVAQDVTAQMRPLGNPLIDFGYRTTISSQPSAVTVFQDIATFQGRLHVAYGDSSDGGGPKLALSYDPSRGLWWIENEESQRWDEEELDHYRIQDGELYLHSYDGLTPGNQLYVRNASGWRVIDTGRGDHMRDTIKAGGRFWIQDAGAGRTFPGIYSAPAAAPSGAFTAFTQTAPTGYTAINNFLSQWFFEFGGFLYASANYSSTTPTQFPWMIRLDLNTPGAVWEVAHADPLTFFPANHFAGVTSLGITAVYDNVVTQGKFSTDATGAPTRPMMIYAHRRKRTDAVSITSALWVADGITNGERRLIDLPGIPTTTTALNIPNVFEREGRIFVAFSRSPAFGQVDRRAHLWVFELTNPLAVDVAAGWTLRFTALDHGLQSWLVDFADGRYYLGEGYSYADDGTTVQNPGYTGGGNVLLYNPLNQAPSVTRTAPAVDATTFANTSVVNMGSSVTVSVTVTDPDATDTIANVKLYSEGVYVADLVNTSGNAWSLAWTPPRPGLHRLSVVAQDSRGEFGQWGRMVNLTVTNQAPSISITSPTAGQTLTSAAPTFTVNVSDVDSLASNVGSRLAKVVWRLNGSILGESLNPPFSLTWTAPTTGSQSLTAEVLDTDGRSTISSAVSFTTAPPSNPPAPPPPTAMTQESFVYPAGDALATKNGPQGWSTMWAIATTPQNYFIAGDSLTYTDSAGSALTVQGGRMQMRDLAQLTGISRAISTSAGSTAATLGLTETLGSSQVLGADGKTVYVAFLMRVTDPRTGLIQVELRNNALSNASLVRLYADYTTTNPGMAATRLNGSTTQQNSALLGWPASDMETKLVVMKVSFGAANADTVRVYVNPSLATEPVTPQHTLSGQSFAFDRIYFGDSGNAGWSDGREISLDEIRIGTTWAEVCPIGQTGINTAPVVTQHPVDRSVVLGGQVVFTTLAEGKRPFTYQWRKNGVNISGATASSHVIWSSVASDAGRYDVLVTNAHGTTASSKALLSTSLADAPSAPSVLGLSAAQTHHVPLLWRATEGALSYNVLRSADSAGPFTTAASGLVGTSFTDTGATGGQTWFYRVTANGSVADSLPTTALSVAVAISPFQLWAAGQNLTGISAEPTADPDNDGLANFAEFALASLPLSSSPVNVPYPSLGGAGERFYSFFRARSDVTYLVEWSSDLITWPVAHRINASGPAGVLVSVPDPSTASGPRFVRLRVE